MHKAIYPIAAAAALGTLAGCATYNQHPSAQLGHKANAAATQSRVFTNAEYGIRLRYPARLELHHDFQKGYFSNDDWKAYAGPGTAPGHPLVALSLPASNAVTTGVLRIGASRDASAVRNCKTIPAAALPGSVGKTTIDGVSFITFKARDAGMSHYLMVHGYRAVHHGTCYAMDVLVHGTNPKVYAPPRTPPFTPEQAFARLTPLTARLRFIPAYDKTAAQSTIATPATYAGLLPCADCPGIDYQLNLLPDHRYAERLAYRDRNVRFKSRGHWRLSDSGRTLVLQQGNATVQKWIIMDGGKNLRMLSPSGQPIHSRLNYSLGRNPHFSPMGP